MDRREETPSDPRLVALCFEPSQLTRARELRGITKSHLADQIGKTPSAISQFESGDARPDAETVARLSLALAIPARFFARKSLVRGISLDACHFRSLKSVSQYHRRQAIRIGEIAQEVAYLLESEGIELPFDEVSPLRDRVRASGDIERFAVEVRKEWKLGLGPIAELIPLLEGKGVRVLPLVDACADVDAFSTWIELKPFMMLAFQKPASRIHFDAVHELGHLLMHEDVSPGNPEAENEADAFASAFLLPRDTFMMECPTRWNISDFRALKRRWHVSVQALVVRAYRLGQLSLASYRRAFMDLNRLGMRRNEPDEWILTRPVVLSQALEVLAEDLPIELIAKKLAIHEQHLRQILEPVAALGQLSLV